MNFLHSLSRVPDFSNVSDFSIFNPNTQLRLSLTRRTFASTFCLSEAKLEKNLSFHCDQSVYYSCSQKNRFKKTNKFVLSKVFFLTHDFTSILLSKIPH